MNTRHNNGVWISLAVLSLAAWTGALAETEASAGPATCVMILAGSAEETPGTWGTAFSATRTVDLTFTVVFRKNLRGEHLLELRVFTPQGDLYQSISGQVAEEGKKAEKRKVPGYAMPRLQWVPTPISHGDRRGLKVDVPFPVGGTLIQTSSLYGQWRVEAYVDGARIPCTEPLHFWITE
ncbi:MAG: hypothetical protein KA419_13375 [Acidobacteria bacterium]|nr:hypothetical protein [Acidobacteriota bacterium]